MDASSGSSSPASATAVRWRTKSRTEPRGSRRVQAAASSERRERLCSRSAASGVATKRRWRRSPMRSISRRTKTSARISSNARAAAWCSFRNAWIRSRASGGSCGLSERRLEGRDHVELATPGDRGAARQVDRAKLDRRTGHRPHHRRRVGRIGEHPQPGEHVADLGPLEERRVAREPERHPALLERRRHQARLAPAGADDHADGLGRAPRRPPAGARSPAPPPAPGRAPRCSARTDTADSPTRPACRSRRSPGVSTRPTRPSRRPRRDAAVAIAVAEAEGAVEDAPGRRRGGGP